MEDIVKFFQMGGYAPFVWSAYGLSAFVFVGLYALSMRSLRQTEAELAELEGQDAASAEGTTSPLTEAN